MSNIKASEENTESPSTYGNEAYREYQNGKERRNERTRYKVK
jgi:hypothetical protein